MFFLMLSLLVFCREVRRRHLVFLDLLVFDGEFLEELIFRDMEFGKTRLIGLEMIDQAHGTNVVIHLLIIINNLQDDSVSLGQP